MRFHSPHVLWLLVPLVLLFSWELARSAGRRGAATWPKIARAWAGAFAVTLGARHTTAESRPRIWLWFGLALCLVALARPQWGAVDEQVFDQSREVLIAVDLSRSMVAQDVKPSRLDRAKLLIQSLLDRLKGERVGLVLFAGTGFLQSPLSADYEILREFLPALQPDYLPEGGSNYRAMLEAAIEAFGTSTADRYLIVLSDGESTEETWKELAGQLREKGIKVIGLGIGTPAGAFIPDGSGGFVKDERGAVVMSRLNGSTLQELAQLTGGVYSDASAWVDLPALLARTVESGQKGEFAERNTARMIERFQWFLAPGLLLLLLSLWAEFPVRPRERALPLAPAAPRGTRRADPPLAAPVTFAGLAVVAWLVALTAPRAAPAQPQAAPPVDTSALAQPLATTVGRLAAKERLSAKDLAELAQTTVTYGERMKSAQQPPIEGALRDALGAVDRGQRLDAKAADWPRLRQQLEDLLKKEERPPEQSPPQDGQENQEQPQQDQSQPKQDPQNQEQSPSGEQKDQQEQPSQDAESAFGDMDEKSEPAKQEPKPQSGTQKVGGQQEQPPEAKQNPELALPLQKLDQVRDQDSPARLYQLLQGKGQQPKKPAKDW
ncbi:MAG TPA: VWA domain-containing protein [Opitutaceae bacterium]|nr:VWA domain-containing protein [Opitutaceae bacterium]